MNKEEEKLLEENGWEVECESPFEIRTEDGSFASGEAADIVLDYLKEETSEETDLIKNTFKEVYDKWYNTRDNGELGRWLFGKYKGLI